MSLVLSTKAGRLYTEGGYVSGVAISLVITIILLAGALGFGGWAFMSRQDYKDNSDKKAAVAATESKTKTEAADAIKYAKEAKSPLKTHKGLAQFGAVTVVYPKTWSGYISEGSNGSQPVNNYFHPDVVPDTSDKTSAYALRVQVVDQAYDRVVESNKSDVENRKLTASPFAFPKVPGTVGTRFEGQLEANTQGVMIVVPMRNMTLKVWTESKDFVPDFQNIILPNLVFSP